MENKELAIFIPTHERADNVITLSTLKRIGYTGEVFLVVDNEDKEIEKYKNKYGNKVIIFNKKEIEERTDTSTNKKGLKTVLFARKFIEEKATELGYRFIMVLDDDIKDICYRRAYGNKLKKVKMNEADKIFSYLCSFVEKGNIAILGIAWAAGFIGGIKGKYSRGLVPGVAASAIIRNMKIPVNYRGAINEDMFAAVDSFTGGYPVFELTSVCFYAFERGMNEGGNNSLYKTYKSDYGIHFNSVLYYPSFCCIGIKKGKVFLRTNWKNALPKILSDKYKRAK